jgi:hypothetical protein
MPGDASILPLQSTTSVRPAERGPLGVRGSVRSGTHAERGVLSGAIALSVIVLSSLLLVLVAANRPGLLSPTSHAGYFPRWMAGPLGGLLAGFTNNGTTLKWLFTGAVIVMYCAYVLMLKRAPRLPARWVVGAIVAVHAIFLLSPPLSLTDLFNYINYGRMEVVYHLNPYTTIPILEPHNDPAFLLSNWHELLSPYGPLFTLVTFAVVPLGVAGSFWALKAILMLTSLGTILLVWKCARLLGRDPVPAVAFTGLNPIVLVWGLGGDHNDFLMVFFIVLGFYLLLRARGRGDARAVLDTHAGVNTHAGVETSAAPGGVAPDAAGERPAATPVSWRQSLSLAGVRALVLPLSALELTAGAAFVAAVALKASGAVLVPVVLAGVVRLPRTLVQTVLGMLAGGVVLSLASLLAFGLHIPDLSTQSQLVTSESIPNLIGLVLGLGGESAGIRTAMDAALLLSVLACCRLAWRARRTPAGGEGVSRAVEDRERAIAAAGWASVALLVTLSWVLPWYVVWLLPLAALSGSRRLRTSALVFGVYLIVIWAPASQSVWNALHFHPEKTTLGRVHQRFVKELLD